MRRLLKLLTSRIWIVSLLVLLQLALLFTWVYQAVIYYSIMPVLNIIAIILAVYVINKDEDPSYKIGWCVLILALPVIGGVLFLLCSGRKMPKKLANGTIEANAQMKALLSQDIDVLEQLEQTDPEAAQMFACGRTRSGFPVYHDTAVQYYGSGEEFFPEFLKVLSEAKQFIFLEMFIIRPGRMWNSVLEILRKKAAEGVDVRVIYDDFGCVMSLPRHYISELQEYGIRACRFNRLRPVLLIKMNNRDHRKICVIDNQIGFTGGVNLADEYINEEKRFGYWRDSAVILKGDAVRSLTVMFLGMWTWLSSDDPEDYSRFMIPASPVKSASQTYYQPFSDTPTDEVDLGLMVHLNLVSHAREYIYIDTPYLILNNDMRTALRLAAMNGVKVVILTPHVPDKKNVFQITRANYRPLLEAGVRIFEFTPGFNHSKSFVSDDRMCLAGTVNTDYRSYYLHFENGILMEDPVTAKKMRESFEQSLRQSQEITLEDCLRTNPAVRIYRAILQLIAPLF